MFSRSKDNGQRKQNQKIILFHTKGAKISPESMRLLYDDSEPTQHNPDPNIELESLHNNNTKPDWRTCKTIGI